MAHEGRYTRPSLGRCCWRCFHVAIKRAWILKSWDRMMVPKPFSRASFYITSPLEVPADATEEQLEQYRQQVQAALDRARMGAEEKLSRF